MSLFRAVAWDIDGTLIDSEPLHQRGLVAASAHLGVDLSDLDPEAFRGVHAIDIWEALKPRFPAGSSFKDMDRGRSRTIMSPMQESSCPIRARSRRCANLRREGWRKRACRIRAAAIVDANIKALGIARHDRVLAQPRGCVVRQARSRTLSRSGSPLRRRAPAVVAVEDSGAGARSARAAGFTWSATRPRETLSSALIDRSRGSWRL